MNASFLKRRNGTKDRKRIPTFIQSIITVLFVVLILVNYRSINSTDHSIIFPYKQSYSALQNDDYKSNQTLSFNWVNTLRNIRGRSIVDIESTIIQTIFSHVKPQNKRYVEFGFGYSGNQKDNEKFQRALRYTKSLRLNHAGWKGWMFDALVSFEELGIFKEVLSPENIVQVFEKYQVPKNIDFLCIDVDSIDLWLLQAIIRDQRYTPTLINIEYNVHFPYESTVTCDQNWLPWRGDMVYGSSFGAILMVAKSEGYVPIHVQYERHKDVYLVRQDALLNSGGRALSIEELKDLCPLPRKLHALNKFSKINRFIDFAVYTDSGDMNKARMFAEHEILVLNKTLFSSH